MVHTTYPKLVRWLGTLALAASLCQAQPFPGAEGFGRFTSGGRGGSVFEVTNLNDHGPGSLRAAIKARGPRTVVFRVSGTIVLQSELRIENGDLTIAGQTAPGSGICIRDYPINIFADNIIIRYIRVRLGDVHKLAEDAASAFFQKDIIIDHCSFSWGTDEVLTIRDNENSTVQWCLISESLSHSYHPKGDHGYGGIWGGMGASFHHNLLAHHTSRTPRFNGSRYHKQPEKELVDYRNNVIYNWGFNSAYGGEAGQQNVLANYYKYGPGTKPKDRIIEPWDSKGKWFVNDNFVYGFPEITADNWAGGVQGKFRDSGRVDAPHPSAPVTTQTAEEAYKLVLANVGAVLPKRDSVDSRIIQEVKSGTATYGGIRGAGSGIIDSQTQVGGWPVLRSAPAPPDSDHDGMPDEWEIENGLNPADPVDRNGDRNGDGYTNLENYLNELASGIEH
jgi:pectate lyase